MNTISVSFSGIRSPIHVVYLGSWLRRLLSSGDVGSVTLHDLDVHIARPAVSGFDRYLPDDERLVRARREPEDDGAQDGDSGHYYVGTSAPGVKPLVRLWRAGVRPKVVVIDDGIGSYGSIATRHAALRREGSGPLAAAARALAPTIVRRVVPHERWAAYERRHGDWVVNPAVRDELQRHRAAVAPARHVAALLTQPWVDLGLLDAAEHLARIRSISDAVSVSGRSLLVKPHPFEPSDRYEAFSTLSAGIPAELDPSVASADVVIGDTSTALLNLSALAGGRIVRLAPPYVPPLSRRQASLFDAFLPESIDDAALLESLGD